MSATYRSPRGSRISRRSFFGTTAGAGTALGASLLWPGPAYADSDDERPGGASPKPISLGIAPFDPFAIKIRHLPPLPGTPLPDINEPSQISDFNGFVGLTRIRGGGTGIDTATGQRQALAFQADMGFNQGEFVGTDGRHHQGTFAFV